MQEAFDDLINLAPTYRQDTSSQDEEALQRILVLGRSATGVEADALDELSKGDDAYVLLRGLPKERPDEVVLMLSARLGSPFAHAKEGALVMKISPTPRASTETPAYNNSIEFDLHSELPYIRHPPDYLALFCVNNAVGAATRVACVSDGLRQLDDAARRCLASPSFRVFIPSHFEAESSHAVPRPIVDQPGTAGALHVRFDNLQVQDSSALVAASTFYRAMSAITRRIVLQPGELLIINNQNALHGRDGFAASNDGSDRDLRRVYIKRDLSVFGAAYQHESRRLHGF